MRPASAGAADSRQKAAADAATRANLRVFFMYLASREFDERHGGGFTAVRGPARRVAPRFRPRRRRGPRPAVARAAAVARLPRQADGAACALDAGRWRRPARSARSRCLPSACACARGLAVGIGLAVRRGDDGRARATRRPSVVAAVLLAATFVVGDLVSRLLTGARARGGRTRVGLRRGLHRGRPPRPAARRSRHPVGRVAGRGAHGARARARAAPGRPRAPRPRGLPAAVGRRPDVDRGRVAGLRGSRAPGRVGGSALARRVVGRARVPPAGGARHRRVRARGACARTSCRTRCSGAITTRTSRSAFSTGANASSGCCSSASASRSSERRSRSARRLRFEGSAALVVLALAAFPTAMLQLRATYVDWPAALLVTAAAAELAAGRAGGGRLRLAGFLFGGAVATKVFALGALPALLILTMRARPRPSPKQVAGALACALAALGPWLAWSARHAGSDRRALRGLAGRARRARGGRALLPDVARVGRRGAPARAGRTPPRAGDAAVRPRLSLEPVREQRRRLQRHPGARPARRAGGLGRAPRRAVLSSPPCRGSCRGRCSTCRRSAISSRSIPSTRSSAPRASGG